MTGISAVVSAAPFLNGGGASRSSSRQETRVLRTNASSECWPASALCDAVPSAASTEPHAGPQRGYPAGLAHEIVEQIEQARDRYQPRLRLEMLRVPAVDSRQAPPPARSEHSKAS